MDTVKRWILDLAAWTAGLFAALALVAHEAMAGGGKLATPPDERWKAECGSCHLAYPPPLLAAEDWRRLMSGLDKHFGTDASLEPAAAGRISAYLERYAAPPRRARPAPGSLRITETAWFLHEHGEVPPSAWKHPAVRTPANCAACHLAAEQGDFRERNVRIPR